MQYVNSFWHTLTAKADDNSPQPSRKVANLRNKRQHDDNEGGLEFSKKGTYQKQEADMKKLMEKVCRAQAVAPSHDRKAIPKGLLSSTSLPLHPVAKALAMG
jgi:hypothetical protein